MLKLYNSFMTALSFLTKFGKNSSIFDFSKALPFFPIVGLVIGSLACLPYILLSHFLSSKIIAWICIGLTFWVTRGLHWDGWADLWDGWGSFKTGEDFWTCLKDSRIGAFGCAGLIFAMCLQAELLNSLFITKQLYVIIWAYSFSRFLCLIFLFQNKTLSRKSGLANMLISSLQQKQILISLLITLIIGLFLTNFIMISITILLSMPFYIGLRAFAKKQNGINGDFLGALIIWAECASFLAGIICA